MSSGIDEEGTKRKRESTDEQPDVKSGLSAKQQERYVAPSSKRHKGDSDSDSDCISQEDLLAQLGLNSVKKLKAAEAMAKRVIQPDPPKQSILDLLNPPKFSKTIEQSPQLRKEKPLVNGCFEDDDDVGDDISSKEKLIVRLQNNLRNEEAKLLLLRKLYSCQNDKGQKEANPTPARTAVVTTATTTPAQSVAASGQRKLAQAPTTQKSHQNVSTSTAPPRVVFLSQPRSGQPVVIAPKFVPVPGKTSQDVPRDTSQRNVRPLRVSTGQNTSKSAPSSVSAGGKVQRPQPVHPGATVYVQSSIGTPVSNSTGLRAVSVHGGNDKMRPAENGLATKPMSSLNIIRTHSPPQQSHSDAKLALRKQLERTLLQIPLPEPPAQDWNFVPSINTQDFTILLGLEGVVNHIVESKELISGGCDSAPMLTPPRFCSQCRTDFTPAWRKKAREEDTKLVTLCETCHSQKIKKTLKTEHTNRLKAEFMKALKQEQEVEQKFQSTGAVSANQSKMDATKSARASSHHQVHAAPARLVYHPPNVHHTLQPQVYQPHHSIVHQLQQQQQLQQQHNQELETPRRQDTRYFTYVGQHNCQPQHKQRHGFAGDNDRQREYLLDMIPSGHTSRSYRI